jgi:hypothetical protein
MQFLYPSFLWALLAAAIPVIIHLFNFRRTKKVYFTNVAFLKAVNTTTSSFRRLKHLLIMAARILAIICLVLAFAQPILTPKSGNIAKSAGLTSMYIDNSLSMQNELNKKSYLDKAINKVEELLTAFPQGSRLQLVTNDFSAQEHSLNNTQQIKERTTTIDYTIRLAPSKTCSSAKSVLQPNINLKVAINLSFFLIFKKVLLALSIA